MSADTAGKSARATPCLDRSSQAESGAESQSAASRLVRDQRLWHARCIKKSDSKYQPRNIAATLEREYNG